MNIRKRPRGFITLADETREALPDVAGFIQHGTPAFVQTNLALFASGFGTFALLYCVQPLLPVLSNALGGMSGRLLTAVISDLWGWRTAILAMGILGLGCGLILWRALPASRHFVASEPRLRASIQTFRLHLSDPALRRSFAEGFLLMGSFVTLYNYISYRLLAPPFSLSQTAVGFIFAVYLFGLFGSAWIGNLAAKMGRLRFFLPAILVTLIGNFLALSDRLWLIIAGVAILTFGFFASHSIASSWVGARARQAEAQASSLYLLAYYLGSSIAGSAGGLFWASAGWAGVISLTGALLLAAMAIALNLNGWKRA
jgi:MFS transporter, YNFM family, putative membrane transport protein